VNACDAQIPVVRRGVGERIMALNDFIRSGAFDGVIDFDKIIVDPQKPGDALPKFDKGDHLHPNAAGYQAMSGAIDLQTFTTK
jgi:lysophospholipase L1-like esterase